MCNTQWSPLQEGTFAGIHLLAEYSIVWGNLSNILFSSWFRHNQEGNQGTNYIFPLILKYEEVIGRSLQGGVKRKITKNNKMMNKEEWLGRHSYRVGRVNPRFAREKTELHTLGWRGKSEYRVSVLSRLSYTQVEKRSADGKGSTPKLSFSGPVNLLNSRQVGHHPTWNPFPTIHNSPTTKTTVTNFVGYSSFP